MKTLLAILLLSVSGLAQTTVTLKTQAARGKYGLVTIYNTDGTVNRQFRITPAQMTAVQAGALPPGVTLGEWGGTFTRPPFAGRFALAQIEGKDFDTGDVEVRNGILRLQAAESVRGGRIVEDQFDFLPGQWSGTPPNVTIPATELAKIPGQPILSVINGVMILR